MGYLCVYMQNFHCVVFIFHCLFFIYLLGGSFEASRVAHTHRHRHRQDIKRTRSHACSKCRRQQRCQRPHIETVVTDMSRHNSFEYFRSPSQYSPPPLALTFACFPFCLLGELWVGRKAQSAQRTRKHSYALVYSAPLVTPWISSPDDF